MKSWKQTKKGGEIWSNWSQECDQSEQYIWI